MEFRVPPGVVFQICPACRAPDQEFDFETAVYCVNPGCESKLFTPTQKMCHDCGAPQPKRQAQQQPKPPRGHVGLATSPPTVPVASVPSTSSDPIGAALPAQHLEAVKKAVEAQRNQTCKDRQSEDDTQTTSPQHMPPTHVMQGAAGSQIPPGFQATMGAQSYLVRHVPAIRPPVPLHSQMVYQLHQGMQTQLPQTGGHTPYPRAFGPAQTFQTEAIAAPGGQNYIPTSQPHTGSPQFSGSQSHDQIPTGVRLPAPVHSQAVHQLQQGTPTQLPQAGGHTPYQRVFGPPEAMPTSSGSPSYSHVNKHSTPSSFQGSQHSSSSSESTGESQFVTVLQSHPWPPTCSPQVPANNTHPSIPNQPTDIPKITLTSESITLQSFTAPPPTSTASSTTSTTSDVSMSTSNEGLSNRKHGQTHQASNSDGTHGREKQMGKKKEGEGDMPVTKPKEAKEKTKSTQQGQEKGQGRDQDEHQLELAVSDPLQDQSAGGHSVSEHTSTQNKRKRSTENDEEISDGSDPLSKQQKVNLPNAGTTEDNGATPSVSDQQQASPLASDQQQGMDNTQPQNPSSYAAIAASKSDQVCPLNRMNVVFQVCIVTLHVCNIIYNSLA